MKRVVFLDANVILDFFLDRKPFSDDAVTIMNLVACKEIKAYVSPVTISNLYYILRKLAGHQKVITKLKLLLGIVLVTSMNRQIILEALDSKFSDFEDALQSFSAADNDKISVLVTRNIRDFKHSQIAVMTPGDFLKVYKR